MTPGTRCYTAGCRQPSHHLDGHRWLCDDCHDELNGTPVSDRIMVWWALMGLGAGTTLITGTQLLAEALHPMTPGRFWQLLLLTVTGIGLICIGGHGHAKETGR